MLCNHNWSKVRKPGYFYPKQIYYTLNLREPGVEPNIKNFQNGVNLIIFFFFTDHWPFQKNYQKKNAGVGAIAVHTTPTPPPHPTHPIPLQFLYSWAKMYSPIRISRHPGSQARQERKVVQQTPTIFRPSQQRVFCCRLCNTPIALLACFVHLKVSSNFWQLVIYGDWKKCKCLFLTFCLLYKNTISCTYFIVSCNISSTLCYSP